MSVSISTVVNAADGLKVTITTTGSVNGTLEFYASKTPGAADLGPLVYTGSGPYTVTVRSAVTNVLIPYYFTASDDDGSSAQVPEWVCYGSVLPWGWQMAKYGEDTLQAARAAIAKLCANVYGSANWPDGTPITVERIYAGGPVVGSAGVYPIIAVTPVEEAEDWAAMPRAPSVSLDCRILCYFVHQNTTVWEGAAYALASAAKYILNQEQHLQFDLPCGLHMKNVRCGAIEVTTEPMGDGKLFVIAGMLHWGGEFLYHYDP